VRIGVMDFWEGWRIVLSDTGVFIDCWFFFAYYSAFSLA
jgi:hypothetical protein